MNKIGLGLLALSLALSACGGGTETTTIEVPSCPELCEAGTSTCEGGVAVRCVESEDGCGVPEVEVCADDQSCSEGACVERICPPTACSLGDVVCKDDANLEICVTGRDGCGVLTVVTCGDRTVCRDGACVGDCVDLDGDGYGAGCDAGPDCDDGNADVSPEAAESCNGVDDNCDGEVDETFELGVDCTGGVGACEAAGVTICNEEGTGTTCDAVPGIAAPLDLCGNDIDDDCDGDTDEDHPTLGEECFSGLGECQVPGVFVCAMDGQGVVCDGEPGEPDFQDACNGLDDDCDGDVDEDFAELGEACSVGNGICAVPGTYICNDEGDGVTCDATEDDPEDIDLCGNGEDDDCDGVVDNGHPSLGEVCTVGVGACQRVGVRICGEDGRETVCSVEAGEPGELELCGNGIDDNCNGDVDEGFEDLGVGCEVGEGICGNVGAFVCSPDRSELVCSAQEGEEQDEICDGLDNDCNEEIDEAFPVGESCEVGVGFCRRTGVEICSLDRLDTVCNVVPGEPLENELCGNQTDDNCDGNEDEGFEALGESCTVGFGICQRTGTLSCSPNRLELECDAVPGPDELEVCDGLDNNCDGVVDDSDVCGVCVDDDGEPNDSIGQATPVAHGDVVHGSVCFFNQDFFSLGQLEAGQVVVLNVLFSDAEGDIDVAVHRDGVFVGGVQGGISADDNEQVIFAVVDAGVYTFQLGIAAGDGATDYRLSVVVADDPCGDDVYEPDDDAELAHKLAPEEARDMTACGDDAQEGGDWFDLGVQGLDTLLDINVEFSHSQGDIDVYLWRDSVQVNLAESINDDETLSHLVLTPGRFFLQVVLDENPPRSNDYTVEYEVTQGVCIDDEFDDDTIGDANLLSPNFSLMDRRACADDEDWYRLNFAYQPGQEITVSAIADPGRGDVDLELYFGNDSTRVAVAATTHQIETLRYRVTTQGTYWVRVIRGAGQPGYRISAAYPQDGGCSPDGHESDSFFDFAVPVDPGVVVALTACPPVLERVDFDFIHIGTLSAGTHISAEITFENAQGDVELGLYRIGDENFVELQQTTNDFERIEFDVENEGEYTLVPFLFDQNDTDGNIYRFRYSLE